MGTMILAAGHLAVNKQPSGGSPLTLVVLVVGIGLLYMLIMRPQRARQRKIQQQQSQVMPGQRIRTTAGLYGTIVSGDERDVVVEISPGVNVTMLRRAVMEVIPDEPSDLIQDGDMPHHEDLVPDSAEESESEHEDAAPADEQDLKDRNI